MRVFPPRPTKEGDGTEAEGVHSEMEIKKHPFIETHPHLVDFASLLHDLNKESERGAVLISSAYIEGQLKKIIAAFLLRGAAGKKLLNEFSGPLGTFAAGAAAAEALGLISEDEGSDLTVIRKIRNEFAHNHRAAFSDEHIAQKCHLLKHCVKDTDARGQFTTAAVSLILNLTNRPHYVSQKRLKRETWPY